MKRAKIGKKLPKEELLMPKVISIMFVNKIVIMRKFIYSVFFLLSLTLSLTAQNVDFDKKNFEDSKGLKKAKQEIKEGDNLFKVGGRDIRFALPHYMSAYEFNPDNAELNYKIGRCLLFTPEKFKSYNFFERARLLDPNVSPDINYYLGLGHHLNYRFDEAIKSYDRHKLFLQKSSDATMLREVNKRIEECKSGMKYVEKPERVWIDNLGPKINSPYPEYGIVLNLDESVMMFTTRRPQDSDPELNVMFEKIYQSNKKGKEWTLATKMSGELDSYGHNAIICLSPDGQKMLLYRDDSGDGNIYESLLKNGQWTKPEKLGKNINTKHHEPTAWYSPDGNILYFVSDKPDDNYGGKDIFKSHWDFRKKRWGEPINLGPTINTEFDEEGVFMHPDGVTLYFASQGHSSMGGYDIFKSVMQSDGSWSEPENIGYPINTTDDDVFFVVSASGRHAYFSSFREGGLGEKDLYKITFLGEEKEPVLNTEDNLLAALDKPIREVVVEKKVEVKSSRMAMLKGLVVDAKTQKKVKAEIEVVDNEINSVIANYQTDDLEGKFLLSLPAGKNYGIAVKADGYLFHSENFDLPDSIGFRVYEKRIELKKVEIGERIVLKNIFFDYDKSRIRRESENELDRLIKLLEDNKSLKIEISGHTDNIGSAAYNQTLSESRAKAVVDYLVDKGIAKNRLEYKGYGKDQPIATNDTPEGRQENRRTEFKILSK
jgi:outer membrane protein OmpA-like peptidoglycan-associated protein